MRPNRCPAPFDLGPQSVSLSAMRFPPAYDRARSALIYNGTARQLIHSKFHNRPEIAALLAPWLQASGKDLLHDADYLIPVPLHLFRLVSRRYNREQALTVKWCADESRMAKTGQKDLATGGHDPRYAAKESQGCF